MLNPGLDHQAYPNQPAHYLVRTFILAQVGSELEREPFNNWFSGEKRGERDFQESISQKKTEMERYLSPIGKSLFLWTFNNSSKIR